MNKTNAEMEFKLQPNMRQNNYCKQIKKQWTSLGLKINQSSIMISSYFNECNLRLQMQKQEWQLYFQYSTEQLPAHKYRLFQQYIYIYIRTHIHTYYLQVDEFKSTQKKILQ